MGTATGGAGSRQGDTGAGVAPAGACSDAAEPRGVSRQAARGGGRGGLWGVVGVGGDQRLPRTSTPPSLSAFPLKPQSHFLEPALRQCSHSSCWGPNTSAGGSVSLTRDHTHFLRKALLPPSTC